MPRKITYKKRGRKSVGGFSLFGNKEGEEPKSIASRFDIFGFFTPKPNNPVTASTNNPDTASTNDRAPAPAPVPGGKRKTIKNKTKKSKK